MEPFMHNKEWAFNLLPLVLNSKILKPFWGCRYIFLGDINQSTKDHQIYFLSERNSENAWHTPQISQRDKAEIEKVRHLTLIAVKNWRLPRNFQFNISFNSNKMSFNSRIVICHFFLPIRPHVNYVTQFLTLKTAILRRPSSLYVFCYTSQMKQNERGSRNFLSFSWRLILLISSTRLSELF